MMLTEWLKPAEMTDERATGDIPYDSISRSYFLMRTFVGILGFALPFILFIGEAVLDDAKWTARGSLSAYYHSGMRDFFVSILAVVGILLVTYKINEKNRDNFLSLFAGAAAIGVAIFPTGIPLDVDARPTPLQGFLGEDRAEVIHFSCALVFVVFLGILCLDFARREGKRKQERNGHHARFPPKFWFRFHLLMAILIFCGIAYIPLARSFDFFEKHSILIGEIVVTVAFGLSWLAKGLDLKVWPKLANR